jgi:hypothetical protein
MAENTQEKANPYLKDFGDAVKHLKEGGQIARTGWNGKNMYLFMIGTDSSVPGTGGWTYTNGKNDNFPLLPFIAMKTADDKVVPWLASQTDILAEDWQIFSLTDTFASDSWDQDIDYEKLHGIPVDGNVVKE